MPSSFKKKGSLLLNVFVLGTWAFLTRLNHRFKYVFLSSAVHFPFVCQFVWESENFSHWYFSRITKQIFQDLTLSIFLERGFQIVKIKDEIIFKRELITKDFNHGVFWKMFYWRVNEPLMSILVQTLVYI